LKSPFLDPSLSPIRNKKSHKAVPLWLSKRKSHGPKWSPMASIPPSGLDLRATLAKIKIKEAKAEHFYILQFGIIKHKGTDLSRRI
jgi:hypothetical protein